MTQLNSEILRSIYAICRADEDPKTIQKFILSSTSTANIHWNASRRVYAVYCSGNSFEFSFLGEPTKFCPLLSFGKNRELFNLGAHVQHLRATSAPSRAYSRFFDGLFKNTCMKSIECNEGLIRSPFLDSVLDNDDFPILERVKFNVGHPDFITDTLSLFQFGCDKLMLKLNLPENEANFFNKVSEYLGRSAMNNHRLSTVKEIRVLLDAHIFTAFNFDTFVNNLNMFPNCKNVIFKISIITLTYSKPLGDFVHRIHKWRESMVAKLAKCPEEVAIAVRIMIDPNRMMFIPFQLEHALQVVNQATRQQLYQLFQAHHPPLNHHNFVQALADLEAHMDDGGGAGDGGNVDFDALLPLANHYVAAPRVNFNNYFKLDELNADSQITENKTLNFCRIEMNMDGKK